MAFKKTRTMEKTQPTRRMDDMGISGGKGDGTWDLPENWFEADDSEFSIPFTITESFEYNDDSKRPKYGFGVVMEGDDSDGIKYYLAFPAANSKGEVHKERQKLFELLQDDSTPIAGCVMQRIDTGQANPFIKFLSVEAMERIIESESEDSEED